MYTTCGQGVNSSENGIYQKEIILNRKSPLHQIFLHDIVKLFVLFL